MGGKVVVVFCGVMFKFKKREREERVELVLDVSALCEVYILFGEPSQPIYRLDMSIKLSWICQMPLKLSMATSVNWDELSGQGWFSLEPAAVLDAPFALLAD